MNIGIFVNDINKEDPKYTSTSIAREAHNRGHHAIHIDVDDFAYAPDDKVYVWGRSAKKEKKYRSGKSFLEDVHAAEPDRFPVADLDVLLLRNDPSNDAVDRPWAQSVGIIFGQLALRHGVIVLNDPTGLSKVSNKLYFQFFPEMVRPKTLISHKPEELKAFVKKQKRAVLKPLQGSGGEGVFMVDTSKKTSNLNQIIETLGKGGYIIAQEYLPAASKGDVRLFLMNGEPLRVKKTYAAMRRVSAKEDIRSNLHSGGSVEPVEVTDQMLELANIVRPKLVQDGMFLVGLDIAGDKLMEINVFSPGGLTSISEMYDLDFIGAVVNALEEKVYYMRYYGRRFDNREIATL